MDGRDGGLRRRLPHEGLEAEVVLLNPLPDEVFEGGQMFVVALRKVSLHELGEAEDILDVVACVVAIKGGVQNGREC